VGLRDRGPRGFALFRRKIRSPHRISLAISLQGTQPEIHDQDLPSFGKARYGRCLRGRSGSMGANPQRQTLFDRGVQHAEVTPVGPPPRRICGATASRKTKGIRKDGQEIHKGVRQIEFEETPFPPNMEKNTVLRITVMVQSHQ
jgi:hypothetical protein